MINETNCTASFLKHHDKTLEWIVATSKDVN